MCEPCKRIFELNAELEKYKAQADTNNSQSGEQDSKNSISKHQKLPLGFFAAGYMIISTLLLTFSLKTDYNLSGFPLYQIIFFLLIPIIIYVGIGFVSEFNIWILAILALLLPKIIIYLALQLKIQPPIDALNSFGKAPYLFGIYVLIASLPFIVFLDKIQLKKVFGFIAIKEYLSNTQTAIDKVEKLVLIITAILASLKTITTIF